MFTFISNLRSKLFYTEKIEENETKSLARQIDDYLSEIDEIRPRNVNTESIQSNLIDDDEGSFLKVGIVSHVTNDSIIIENKYMCEWKNVIPTDLKIGDEVQYSAYKIDKDADLRIRKVNCKIDSTYWDTEKYDQNLENNEIVEDDGEAVNLNIETVPSTEQVVEGLSDRVIERKDINRRTIVGKVYKRKGREIFIEEDDICINLDRVSSEFVPVVGDWVQLHCLVEVNEDVPNFKGEILDIESISPLRQLNKLGKVTEYNEGLESGTVEKHIVFSKAVCMPGYIPCVGDKVVVQSIESDQGLQQHWRALQVVPLENVPNRFETSTIKFKPQLPENELVDLLKDKENIAITDQISVSLDAKTETVIDVVVKNNGSHTQKIIKCAFLSKLSDSQLSVLLPVNNEPQMLDPSEEIKYRLKVKARFVGVSEELIIFKFRQFKIARIIKITVKSINTTNQDSNKIVTNRYVKHKTTVVRENYEEGMYIRGVKPYTPAKFIALRPVTWKIPDILWNTIHSIIEEKKTRTEAEQSIQDKIPCLEKHLCFENYKQRFDYLLYLEEIEQILNMQKFCMSSATMHRSAEYLTLNVPGLAEKRPSLITGDRVIVSFKWDESGGKRKYEGYIHKIKSSDVYLKFDPKFHEDYHGEDCQIEFKGSTTVIQRCHTAVATVINRLGRDILFPKKVVQKEPQYNFVDDDDEKQNSDEKTDEPQSDDQANNEDDIKVNGENDGIANGTNSSDSTLKKIEAYLYSRHIKWFNKQLNIYQKEAIKNVLKGLARPLPYIIFGPPGTGKTVTVCEGILQILTTITESRILIATPSNSSANLIAERLLDSKQLKPGDMVRLVAHHYLESDSIPEKILPYCVTADISSEGSRAGVNLEDDRGCKTNVTLSVLCRHRIIVGTCSALGILYNMGCKPGHFTHIVIDEAGQATEPEIMIPLSLAHASSSQIVLAGDPKQLGPVNQSRLANYFGLDVSFLVRLLQQFPYQRDPIGFKTGYDPRLITKLLMNYRSLPDLLYLPNKLFYEAELIPQVHPEESDEAELLMSLSDMLPKRLGAPPSVIFHGVNGTNMQEQDSPSWYNPEEATQVYIYLLELYNHGLDPNDIGIISPYSKQVFKIKHLLAELDVEIPKVGSVEEFQGQERKVILLSTVRTATDKLRDDVRHALGFVAAPTRLNVAITRARTLLIIIGCPKLLLEDVYWRSVLDHCAKRNSWIGHKSEN